MGAARSRRLKKLANGEKDVAAVNGNENDDIPSTPPESFTSKLSHALSSVDKETIKTVATYSLIGTVAIVVGFFAGSSSSRRS